MASVTFLGTGGGRFVILNQRRYSGGLWLDLGPKISLDPGPGALIRALQYGKDPQRLDAVIVSHRHIDHYNDAEVMIEAMTGGMKKKRGTLVLNKGAEDYISDYHKTLVDVRVVSAGDCVGIGGVDVSAIPTENHENGTGFRFMARDGVLTYTSDTAYSEKLIRHYKGSRVLILNTIFPGTKEMGMHLNTKTALKIVRKASPELAVINHFGVTMLNAGPGKEAASIQEETGDRTIAARDGMEIDLKALSGF